jgi:tetratricopeptide (TPR) repeat protein
MMRNSIFRACAILLLGLAGAGFATPVATVQNRTRAELTFDALVAAAKSKMLTDPMQTVRQAKAAELVAEAVTDHRRSVLIATALWLQGEAYVRLNDSVHAEPLIDRAIALMANAGPPSKLKGDLLLSKGGLETMTADVAGALASYQKAHNIYRDIGDTRSRAIALASIALLYQEIIATR